MSLLEKNKFLFLKLEKLFILINKYIIKMEIITQNKFFILIQKKKIILGLKRQLLNSRFNL